MKGTEMQEFETIIKPKNNLFDLNLREVWKYRDLIYLYTKRSFQVRYKQTILGPAWLFLTPFISSIIYAFVFGGIAGISTDGIPAILFYIGGTTLWTFFSTSLTSTASTFTANAAVFGKVYFPRLTMPISTVFSAAVNFFIQMIMFLFFWVYYIAVGKVSPNYWAIPLIIPVMLQMGALALGLGVIISSITTKYRDLSILVGFGVQLWMYVTPIVYPMSTLKAEWMRNILLINPVTCGVEAFRYAFLGSGMMNPFWWGITTAMTLLFLFLGIVIFNKVEKTFMDTV